MINYSDAFKKLKLLDEEVFNLDNQGLADFAEFKDNDNNEDPFAALSVIDDEATKEDDLQDSYIGKIILECPVCGSLLYKNAEEVNVDDELGLANTDQECPYCYTTQGFKVIGKVAEAQPEMEVEATVTEPEETVTEPEVQNEATDEFTEVQMEQPASNPEDFIDDLDKEEEDKELSLIDFNSEEMDMSLDDDKKKEKDFLSEDDIIEEKLNENLTVNEDGGFDDYKVEKITSFEQAQSYAEDDSWVICKNPELFVMLQKYTNGIYFLLNRQTDLPEFAVINCLNGENCIFDKDNNEIDASNIQDIDFDNLKESLAKKEESMLAEGVTDATVDLEDKELTISVSDGSLNKANLKMDDGKNIDLSVQEKDLENNEPEEILDALDNTDIDRINSDETIEPEVPQVDAEEPDEEFVNEPIESDNFDTDKEKDLKGGLNDILNFEESIDNIDEVNTSRLIERYFKRTYSNVKSFNLTEAFMSANGDKVVLNGNILFESGANKKTSFTFVPNTTNGSGKVSFLGENIEMNTGNNSFELSGNIINEEFVPTKLKYNHSLNESVNKGVVTLVKLIESKSSMDESIIDEDQILDEYRTKGAVNLKKNSEAPAPKEDFRLTRFDKDNALALAIYSDPELKQKFEAVVTAIQKNIESREYVPAQYQSTGQYAPMKDSNGDYMLNDNGNVKMRPVFIKTADSHWEFDLNGFKTQHWTVLRDAIVKFLREDLPNVTIEKNGITKVYGPGIDLANLLMNINSNWPESSAYKSILGTIGAKLTSLPESSITEKDGTLVHYGIIKQ